MGWGGVGQGGVGLGAGTVAPMQRYVVSKEQWPADFNTKSILLIKPAWCWVLAQQNGGSLPGDDSRGGGTRTRIPCYFLRGRQLGLRPRGPQAAGPCL